MQSERTRSLAEETGVFTSESTHGIVRREGITVMRESAPLGWRTLYASLVKETPWSAELPRSTAPGIAFSLGRPCGVVSQLDSLRREAVLRPRQFSVLPSSVPSRWSIGGTPQILFLYVRPSLLESVLQQMSAKRAAAADLLPRFCVHDPVIDQIAEMVLQLMREGATGQHLLVDQVALLLATRLVGEHSTHAGMRRPLRQLMPRPAWHRVLEYIDAHLDGPLDLESLAQIGGVHSSHIWRSFQANLGTSPHRYVNAQRLQKARRLLSEAEDSIADVAAQLGYSSQSHFAAAFRKAYAMSPAEFRRSCS